MDNERLVTHITSPPPPKDRAPQDPHFERWHPGRKALSITEWINRCTEKARLNRLSEDDTLAYMKLALSSVSGDFEVLAPEVRNNLTNFKAWLQKQYQPLFPHHAIILGCIYKYEIVVSISTKYVFYYNLPAKRSGARV